MIIINYLLEDDLGTWECNALTECTISKWIDTQNQWHQIRAIHCKIIIKNVIKLGEFEDYDFLREHFESSSIRIR